MQMLPLESQDFASARTCGKTNDDAHESALLRSVMRAQYQPFGLGKRKAIAAGAFWPWRFQHFVCCRIALDQPFGYGIIENLLEFLVEHVILAWSQFILAQSSNISSLDI